MQTLMDALFARLLAYFGTQAMQSMWNGQNLDAVKTVWGEALSQFKPETVVAACRDLEQSGKLYPPTLPEFVSFCRVAAQERARPAYNAKQLEAPRVSPQQAAAAREQLKALVAKMMGVAT